MNSAERTQADAVEVIRGVLAASGLDAEQPTPTSFVVTLPGEHKQATVCSLVVGDHALSVNAFVARCPDENHAEVHERLMTHNARLFGVAFALDRLGDIYLVGRWPLSAVTPGDVDRLLGSVLDAADSTFDAILAIGFASSIRREWDWRQRIGLPVDNLEPFRGPLDLPTPDDDA